MTSSKPLSLAVATLLKIGQKHKAAVSFDLQSLVLEMEQEFVDGKLALTCGIRSMKYVDFPCDEAREIALQLFENKLIPDYSLEETDSAFEENEYMARYSPFDMSQAHELNRELQKLVKDTEKDTKAIIQAADICDKEDAKLINDVVAASAKDILHCRERDDVENKVRAILFDMLLTEGISNEDRLVEDLGADSLDLAEILMSIEEDFQIEVPDEDAEKIKTVGQIVNYLVNREEERPRNQIRETKPAPQKQVNAELIMKYLKNKGGRATLKQIQSRFKGYSGNKCRQIAVLITGDSGLQIRFSPTKFSESVVEYQEMRK